MTVAPTERYVDEVATAILEHLRTGRAVSIPPASDTDAWADIATSAADWHKYGGWHPMWARDNQLAAVAVLRDLGLVEIGTQAHDADVTADDPGVTIIARLRDGIPS